MNERAEHSIQTRKREGIGTANGKIILIGEHAVVYAQPAIALPFKEVQVTTTVTAAGEMTVDCVYHHGPLSTAPTQLANLQAVVPATLAELGLPDQRFHIHIDSTIPAERGMGSSAAVANSVVRAIYAYADRPLDDETLFRLTQISETIAHGNPSGLDAKITVSEQPLYFVRGQVLEPFEISLRGYLVVADTGEKGQTMQAVNALGQRREEAPERVNGLFEELGKLSRRVREVLTGDELPILGACMTRAQEALRELGVSNASLDHLIDAAQSHGALGSKLTGGGWGGCILALTPDPDEAKRMQSILQQSSAHQTWVLAL